MIDLQRIARHYGGDVAGGQALIPAIGHSKADRGVAVRPAADAPDGCLVHCFNGGDPLAEKGRLRDDGFLPAFEPQGRPKTELVRPQRIAFDYVAPGGQVLYRNVRIEVPGRDKTFRCEHPDGNGGWATGRGGKAVPYRWPELEAADPYQPLYLTEGEAKADRLSSWGLLATSHKAFPVDFTRYFVDRKCIILPDNDQAGIDQARKAFELIDKAGGHPVILPPFPGVGPGGDLLDWRGDKTELEAMARAARPEPVGSVVDDTARGLAVIDAADFCGKVVPIRRWMTAGIEPMGSATFLTGAGATGKSLLAQQWMTCTALGMPLLGIDTHPALSLYLTCEDDAGELHRRQEAINRALGIEWEAMRGKLFLASLKGQIGNELCTFGSDGKMALTPRWHELLATVKQLGIRHLALDNTAHLFAGNENDRHHVAAFVGLLDRLAQEIDGAVLFIGHPNKAGDEFSGSTAWENQVRSRLFLSLEKGSGGAVINPDGRTLSNSKPNYSERGKAIAFVWHDWAFYRPDDLPRGAYAELEATIAAAKDNEIFLACLAERTRQQRAVSEKRSSTYAPHVFASMPESQKIGKARLEVAMDRLFRIDKIERGNLTWKQDRKPVQGIRLKCADGCGDGAETLCADAGDYI